MLYIHEDGPSGFGGPDRPLYRTGLGLVDSMAKALLVGFV
jgi:hypothetical protein